MAKGNTSVLKRIRQNLKRNEANKSLKSEIKTYYNYLTASIKNNDKEKSEEYLKKYTSKLDKAVKNNILHKNNAARKKARLTKLMNKSIGSKKKEVNA